MSSDYVHDVFISVKHGTAYSLWVNEVFVPTLTLLLEEDVAALQKRRPTIFFYNKSLLPGDPWPQDLKDAILTSRVAVALCSPTYFQSKWCLAEFKSFLKREKDGKGRMLIPVSIHDGEHFPEWARQIQAASLGDYAVPGYNFRSTPKYSKFQAVMKELSALVAKRVKEAPPFQDWPFIDEDIYQPQPPIHQVRL